MQSSTMLTVRAVIVLACTIIVPVLAVFGTSWLSFATKPATSPPANRRMAVASATQPPAKKPSAGPLSPAVGPAVADITSPPAAFHAPATPTSLAVQNAPLKSPAGAPLSVNVPPGQSAPPVDAPRAASYESPLKPSSTIPQANLTTSQPQSPGQPELTSMQPRSSAVTPAVHDGAPGSAAIGSRADYVQSSGNSTTGLAASSDWFTATQQRLRDLGATYYLLETWGRHGELYRFHCKMAIAGNADYTRYFEATDTDASRAMQQVLRQVEAWRAGSGR